MIDPDPPSPLPPKHPDQKLQISVNVGPDGGSCLIRLAENAAFTACSLPFRVAPQQLLDPASSALFL